MRLCHPFGAVQSVAAMLLVIVVPTLRAQQPTAVQLPTFRYFGVGTTVTVPDRGSTFMGGISRAHTGSVSRGVPLAGKIPGLNRLARNRSIGSEFGASSVRAHATIIDNQELDRQVLAEAARRREAAGRFVDYDALRRADYLSRNVGRGDLPWRVEETAAAAPTAAEIRLRNDAAQDARATQMEANFARGMAAARAGKLGAARVYFGMVARGGNGDLQRQAAEQLARLSSDHRLESAITIRD